MAKVNKKSVNYSLGMKDSHCGKTFKDDNGYCKYYNAEYSSGVGTCDKVSGAIRAIDWCKLFEKAT